MPYNSVTTRSNASALIPEQISTAILNTVTERSGALQLMRRLPNMSTNQTRMPVLSSFPTGYFVNGDTGLKQTSSVAWENKYLDAEEIAVIVPISDAVMDDVNYDIWGEVRPLVEQAFGKVIDQAIFYGTNAPASWPDDLLTGATAAGHVASLAAFTDIYDAVLGESGVVSFIEQDGYMADGFVGALNVRAKLRGARSADGIPIFTAVAGETTRYQLDGERIIFPKNGAVVAASSLLIAAEWEQLVYSVRQDMTYKILDQAAIFDASGALVYNLPQQDMVALRCVMRLAWQLPNPINSVNTNSATRYPAAVLTN